MYHENMVTEVMQYLQTLGKCPIPNCDKHSVNVDYDNLVQPKHDISRKAPKRLRDSISNPDEDELNVNPKRASNEAKISKTQHVFTTNNVSGSILDNQVINKFISGDSGLSNSNDEFVQVSSRKAAKALNISDSFPSISTKNSFYALSGSIDMQAENDTANTRPPKIHPVMVKSTLHYKEICQNIKSTVVDAEFKLQGEYIRVYTKTIDQQRAVYHCCRENGYEYFVITPIIDRPLKVVIKGIPRDTPCSEIQEELSNMGYFVEKVVQIKRLRDKAPLPIFQIQLKKNEQVDQIYNIKHFMYLNVEVQKFIRPNQINQCYNCQGFGHSSANCNIRPKCVKCGQGHPSNTCSKSRETPATCANCSGNHPASYRNCPMFPKPRPHRNISGPSSQPNNRQNLRREGVNYSQAVSGQSRPLSQEQNPTNSQATGTAHFDADAEVYLDTDTSELRNELNDLKNELREIKATINSMAELFRQFQTQTPSSI